MLLLLAAAPVKLAAPGLSSVNVDPQLSELFLERFVVLAKQPELSVVTSRDVVQVLGLERQKELLGCSTSSCIAELAGALGADALLSGTVAKSDRSYTLVLKAIRATDAGELVSATVRAGSEDELQEWIETHAHAFGEKLIRRVRGEPEPAVLPSWPRWVTLTGGIAVAGTGALLRGAAEGSVNQLRNARLTNLTAAKVDVASVAGQGRAFEATGNVMLGVGGALLATSAVLFLVRGSESPISLVPVSGGGALVVGGRF